MEYLTRLLTLTRVFVTSLLLLPLLLVASEHGGEPAASKEHGGEPAASKEHGGEPAAAKAQL